MKTIQKYYVFLDFIKRISMDLFFPDMVNVDIVIMFGSLDLIHLRHI